jgi:hypothetical protein
MTVADLTLSNHPEVVKHQQVKHLLAENPNPNPKGSGLT